LVIAVELQFLRCLFYRIRGCAAGFERAVVEHPLDGDEAAQFVGLRRLAAGESAPRKAGEHRRSRIARQGHRPGQVVELQHSCLHRHQGKRQGAQASPEAWVGAERLNEGLGLRQSARNPGDLLGRQEQQSIPFEEGTAVEL
jgi:hypothetical protein